MLSLENLELNEEQIIDIIFPDYSHVEAITNIMDNDTRNHWEHINVLIYGRQGSGKSETVNYLAARAIKKYSSILDRESIQCLTSDGNLGGLIDNISPEAKCIILFCDNLTYYDIPAEDLRMYYEIRHHAKATTGRNTGLIVTFIATHRFHNIPLPLRQDPSVFMIKSVPTIKRSYDYNFLCKMIGEDYLNLMYNIELEKIENKICRGYTLAYSYGKVFLFYASSVPNCFVRIEDYD